MSIKQQVGTMYYGSVLVNYDYGIVNDKSNFCITGYYWGKNNVNRNSREGKTYGELAQRMIDSCVANNCNYFMCEVPEFAKPKMYQTGINFKPEFILHTLEFIAPRAVINIDTDMIITKFPALFDCTGIDYWGYNWYFDPRITLRKYPFDCFAPYILRTSGGIMAFGNSIPAKKFVKMWADYTASVPGKAEDMTISVNFAQNNEIMKLRCMWLPINYFLLPNLYEFENYYNIKKKYQKFFPHLEFSGDKTAQKYKYTTIFDITKDNTYIVHPEGLTTEEQAALQGASTNRVPEEYLVETGKKLRCLTDMGMLINIPQLYCDNAEQVKSFSYVNKCLDDLGYQKLHNNIPPIKNKSYFTILEENIIDRINNLYVFVNSQTIPVAFDFNIKNHNYIVCDCDYNKPQSISYMIHKLIEKYNMSVVYISDCLNITDEKLDIIQEECGMSDFACINGNGQMDPVYKNTIIKPCYDVRALETITTDILYFKNNKFGKNLLKLWNHCKTETLEERDALSIAFNRYGCIVFMRVNWFSPGFYVPKNQKIFQVSIDPILVFESSVSVRKDVNLYDYFKQCGSKAALKSLFPPYKPTHLKPSRYTKNN
jgi:hypothetical protein